MKRLLLFIPFLSIGILLGCFHDREYHYNYVYMLANHTENPISGELIWGGTAVRDPLKFEVVPQETIKLLTRDGGDGPHEKPIGTGNWKMNTLHLDINGMIKSIDVSTKEDWDYTTDGSTGIYTFFITEERLIE